MSRFAPMLALPHAPEKPRRVRRTMVFDRGWPAVFIEGVLEAYAHAVDIAKISAWHLHQPEAVVRQKIDLYKRYDIETQVGGPVLEIARVRGQEDEVLEYLRGLGFDGLEISSEALPTQSSLEEDAAFADKCRAHDFILHGEVGKKFFEGDQTRISETELDVEATIRAFQGYVDMGCDSSYFEGHVLRSILGNSGEREEGRPSITALVDAIGLEHLIFEVPGTFLSYADKRALQGLLVYMFGPNVNVGNVLIEEVAELEEIRDGLFPTFGAPNGDHPWLRSLASTGTGQAEERWWQSTLPIA